MSFTSHTGPSAVRDPADGGKGTGEVTLKASPNPTIGPVVLTLRSALAVPMDLNIMDLQGRLVRTLGADKRDAPLSEDL